jgi:hypothetical protein
LYNWIQSLAPNGATAAAVLSNSEGISNGVVISSFFNLYNSQWQGAVLVHEASHYAYQMNDAQLYNAVLQFNPGFNPANYGSPAATSADQKYTVFLAKGCPEN